MMIANMELVAEAIEVLRSGGLVGFPTETVYGLGADATNAVAIEKIFRAKGRPGTNPLIVHVADATVARRYAAHWPDIADKLARAFWPGPLTLVVPRGKSIVDRVTAGKDTVGLRAPNHPLTLELLRAFDGAMAGPSANRSNRVSPTTAEHVRRELGTRVNLILDGGPCSVGIESTVLDLCTQKPTILRPGAVTQKQIEAIVGPVKIFFGSVSAHQAASSPGQQETHYSPATPAYRFDPGATDALQAWRAARPGELFAIITRGKASELPRATIIKMPNNPAEYARKLYAALHEADEGQFAAIWVEMPPDDGAWDAIRDRIRRATKIPG